MEAHLVFRIQRYGIRHHDRISIQHRFEHGSNKLNSFINQLVETRVNPNTTGGPVVLANRRLDMVELLGLFSLAL